MAIIEKLVAGKWIAGPEIADAINRARQLNKNHEKAILNYLGEELSDIRQVADAVGHYKRLVSQIKGSQVQADISLKITQLGLGISYAVALKNYKAVVSAARRAGVFVWLDMEASKTVSATIRAYESELGGGGVGLCLQAYLKRSEKDMQRLVKKHAVIRLVKGAYDEPASKAFKTREEVSRNYEKLMLYLFKNASAFTLATHDDKLVERARILNRSYQKNVTYAFLNGIRTKYARSLAEMGEHVSIYVPFGSKWLDYAYRRMREQGHASLVLKSLLGG
ncbi:MAG: proline dehydrogenase family protein [Candidatus Micrarchaeia archaeon]